MKHQVGKTVLGLLVLKVAVLAGWYLYDKFTQECEDAYEKAKEKLQDDEALNVFKDDGNDLEVPSSEKTEEIISELKPVEEPVKKVARKKTGKVEKDTTEVKKPATKRVAKKKATPKE